ncbi:MAG: RecQ family ATP-dependent DNA helicase [Chitinophagaceae bacterium]|nr:RecQ family ATP-dependent DNA helicase [Chitinophagaceae bacterium]
MQSIQEILKKYWGFEVFRSLQQEIILAVLAGKDTLALLPTGGGKSICFQVPAMAKEGLCLVVSPLIALMKDQVENLKKKGIPALSIYSGMSFWEVKKTLQNAAHGNYKFLYVSPERLESTLFLEFLPALPVNLIAVDEAHCVSQWGYDFRPPYLRIAALREHLPEIPILALTASATREVQDDICEKLIFQKDHQRFQKSFARPNLSYSVFNVAAKQNKLLEVCKNVKGSGIVYCKSRKRTREVSELLTMNGIRSDFYHAGLTNALRMAKQESWVKNEIRIIVCTNAFGMGIDKSDVRVVVHYDVPDALENYYQEAGRAGRDEKRAYAVLLYHENEIPELEQQSKIRYPLAEEVRKVYKALVNYLQLPKESGEGIYFDFDVNDFVKKFNLNIYTASYSLKILEQEGLISYNEQFFMPSTVVFTLNKNGLYEFEKSNPEFEPVIKGLLRSYEGIFDYPAAINETQLAKFINTNQDQLIYGLKRLQLSGVLNYNPLKDKPQILFLQNRMDTQDFTINMVNVNKRKLAFEKRVRGMITYVNKTVICRSRMIGTYFNDVSIKPCGICDNCINEKNLVIAKDEFENICSMIYKLIDNSSVPVKELLFKLVKFKKNKIWKVLNYLQSEDKIKITRDGSIVKADYFK